MNRKIKVMTVFGTRPEAIKMAPVVQELERHSDSFETVVAVTAQHREMLDQVLNIFDIHPYFDLNMMTAGQTLSQITSRVMEGMDRIFKETEPDIVLVHGDTTTSMAASLTAFYNHIQIGHVEAGLRTSNKYSPFPEEMNRELTGVMADFHFAPTEMSRNNLLRENKRPEQITVTGNTAIDALHTTVSSTYASSVLHELTDKRIILMTTHRRENLGENMYRIFQAVRRLVATHPDIHVLFPVHLNPAIQKLSNDVLGDMDRIRLIEPLDVIDFHNFAARTHLILTDSGGVQEEAPSLGVPVLVLRNTTERPEGVEAGTLKLTGTREEDIFESAHQLLTDQQLYQRMANAANPYGDGSASRRIVEEITKYMT
ncbi:non-hydrolyzing UDP-N-acetylglucosamine 2-epimerase [Salibacterium lacus]|uniref:UDP-N-acetylglucosamine 2-epimerase (non-hydrolyzing) n=1 Tax=Salibacterium lacus TaxID=1898109 RepID=A0ABW5T586_9BACI